LPDTGPERAVDHSGDVGARHVFVDDSGRRALGLRLAIVPLAALMSIAGGAALLSLAATTSKSSAEDAAVQVPGPPTSTNGPFAIDLGGAAPPGAPPCTTLEGMAYEDHDLNGARQPDEPGAAGLLVTAFDAAGNMIGQTSSDGSGRWTLTWAQPQAVRLELSSPDLSMSTGPRGIDSSAFVSFPPEEGCRVDAGIVWSSGVGDGGHPAMELGDRAWADADCDGLQDPGEPAMAGITVQLLDEQGQLRAEAVTSATGEYRFGGLEGDRRYRVVAGGAPAGHSPTRPRVGAPDPASDAAGEGASGSPVPFGGADSDGVANGAAAVAEVTTGAPGTSDHSVDFGWANSCPATGSS
jgi:hypothetical protein